MLNLLDERAAYRDGLNRKRSEHITRDAQALASLLKNWKPGRLDLGEETPPIT